MEDALSSTEEDSAFEIPPSFVAQGQLCVKLSPWHRVNLANSKQMMTKESAHKQHVAGASSYINK